MKPSVRQVAFHLAGAGISFFLSFDVVAAPVFIDGRMFNQVVHASSLTDTATASCSSENLKIDIGYFERGDTRALAYDSAEDSAVQILQTQDSWCSVVLISPDFALTAAHCIDHNPVSLTISDASGSGPSIKVDRKWKASHYGEWVDNRTGALFEHEDFGIIHLSRPVPPNIQFLEVAAPKEVVVGAPAKSLGFPGDRFDGQKRLKDENCSVRNLDGDSILTDCAATRGDSGGPLLVKTTSGKWKIAGICSTDWTDRDSSMARGLRYSDAIANRYTNITYYSSGIKKSAVKFNGEEIPSLAAGDTYPARCLEALSSNSFTQVMDTAYEACKKVSNRYAFQCFRAAFGSLTRVTDGVLAALISCDNPNSAASVTKLVSSRFSQISDEAIIDSAKAKSATQARCISGLVDASLESGQSIQDSRFDDCLR